MRTDEERQQRLSELQHERQATVANITERQDAMFPADVQRQYEQNQGGQDLSASSTPDDPTLRSDAEAQVRERNEKEVADAVAPIDAQIKDVGSRSPGEDGHDAAASANNTGQKSDDVSHDRDAGSSSSASSGPAADHSDAVASPSDQGVADSPGAPESAETPENEPEPEPREESGFESYHEESSSEPEAPAEDHARSSTQHSSYTTGPEQSPSALGHLQSVRTPSEQSQPAAAQGTPGQTAEGQPAQSKDAQSPAAPQQQAQSGPGAGEARVPWSERPATVTTGAQENPRFEAIYPGGEKPYADDGQARTATTDTDRFKSSRLYEAKPDVSTSAIGTDRKFSNPKVDGGADGRWSQSPDPTQYTPQQLQKMDALPGPPDSIADRHHPKGQTLTESEAGKNAYGPGGGQQIEARDMKDETRNTPRADWNEAKQQWDMRPTGEFNRAANPKDYAHEKPAGDRPASGDQKAASTAAAPPEAAAQKSADAPAKTGPEQAAAPAQSQPAQSQPAQSQPAAQAQPAQPQPAQSQPAQAQPGQSQAAQSPQAPAQPAQSQAQPVQSSPAQSPQAQSQATPSQPGQSQPGQSQPAQSQPAQTPSGQIAPPSEPNFSAGSGPAPGVKPPSEPNMPAGQSGQAPEVKPPSEPNYSQPQSQSTPQQAPPSQGHDH